MVNLIFENTDVSSYRSGPEGVPVMLPGFAIIW